MPYIIGLTGNIACGKSTVARMLSDLGAEVIDADKVAHQIMAPPGPVFQSIVRAFGPTIVAADGTINRKELGAIVFSDPDALRRLDALVHPHTSAAIRHLAQNSPARVVVIEAIKLIEAGTSRICDAIWIVNCRREQQIERLMHQRGISAADAEQRVSAQAPIDAKLPLASLVIDSSGSLEDTRRQVVEAWDRLGLLT